MTVDENGNHVDQGEETQQRPPVWKAAAASLAALAFLLVLSSLVALQAANIPLLNNAPSSSSTTPPALKSGRSYLSDNNITTSSRGRAERVVFLRLLGIEGSGHHGILPFIERLTKHSGAVFRNGITPWRPSNHENFRSKATDVAERFCKKIKSAIRDVRQGQQGYVLVLSPEYGFKERRDGSTHGTPLSFPFWGHASTAKDLDEIKSWAVYDVEWMDRTARECDAQVEFRALLIEPVNSPRTSLLVLHTSDRLKLCLILGMRIDRRPFELQALSRYTTSPRVTSEGGRLWPRLVGQAHIGAVYMSYLSRELERFKDDPRVWARVHYEDFGEKRCADVVAAFARWLELPSPPLPSEYCAWSHFRLSQKSFEAWSRPPEPIPPADVRFWEGRQHQASAVMALKKNASASWTAFSPMHPERELLAMRPALQPPPGYSPNASATFVHIQEQRFLIHGQCKPLGASLDASDMGLCKAECTRRAGCIGFNHDQNTKARNSRNGNCIFVGKACASNIDESLMGKLRSTAYVIMHHYKVLHL